MGIERVADALSDLVAFPSVSSTENTSISGYVIGFLQRLGLDCEQVAYQDRQGVEKLNVIATTGSHLGSGGLAYCAHTDVVPVSDWSYEQSGPFELHRDQGKLFGRGSCDMKGSLACFLVAMEPVDLTQ
ncbi:MAG: M20/M25/M40 family metallo-hydrolase, partial [Planctomycetaceae bacterium]|nr:M20/M25/M40 family metallo-hydrolase [Planctomycetaceae bacterium]